MRRRLLIIGAITCALAGCSSGGDERTPARKPLTVDQQLHAALLTPGTLAEAGLDADNPGSRFDETETTKYSLVSGCGASFDGDAHIDGEWQASFGGRTGEYLIGTQTVVHYRSDAAAAQSEIHRKLSCAKDVNGLGYPSEAIDAPTVAGVFVHCLRTPENHDVSCQAVSAVDHGLALAVTIRGDQRARIFDAIGKMGPVMRLAVAGRQPVVAGPSPSPSTTPPPRTGVWTKAVARERFTTMLKDRNIEFNEQSIERLLDQPDSLAGLTSYAGFGAEDARIVGANLGAGRWSADLADRIRELRAALATEQRSFAAAARTKSVSAFRAVFPGIRKAVAATQAAIARTSKALGD